jgi:hypothetical protein
MASKTRQGEGGFERQIAGELYLTGALGGRLVASRGGGPRRLMASGGGGHAGDVQSCRPLDLGGVAAGPEVAG